MPWDPFRRLIDEQRRLLDAYQAMPLDFNRRINLISRDADAEAVRMHCLHCLFLTYRRFPPGALVVDWGTGGGFPAVPLAIACPDIQVVAVDKVGKKVQALRAMIRRLGLANIMVRHSPAETFAADTHAECTWSVSRATAPLRDLWGWHGRIARPFAGPMAADTWRPGMICLKGGDLTDEMVSIAGEADIERIELADMDPRPWFRDKAMLACVART